MKESKDSQDTASNVVSDIQKPITTVEDIVIDLLDFDELLELEKVTKQTEEQFNRIAGSIKRLEKDLDLYHNQEKTLNNQIDLKRKELIKRYKINEKRQWRIDITTRKIVYQS